MTTGRRIQRCTLQAGEAWMVPAGEQQVAVGIDLRTLAASGPFAAICLDGTPLWLAGIHELWPQVGIAWELVLDRTAMARHTVSIIRLAQQQWTRWLTPGAWRWLEAQVLLEDTRSQRWLHWLGFEPLATKPGYGPQGETIVVYAWQKETQHGA